MLVAQVESIALPVTAGWRVVVGAHIRMALANEASELVITPISEREPSNWSRIERMAARTIGTGTAFAHQPVATHVQMVTGRVTSSPIIIIPFATNPHKAIHVHRVGKATRTSGGIAESVNEMRVLSGV